MNGQTIQILNYMLSGRSITSLEALCQFNCLRLSARIYDLSKLGYDIIRTPVKTASGKRIMAYSIKVEK